jgi:drug/metabolite transporter (DMT)-like permease
MPAAVARFRASISSPGGDAEPRRAGRPAADGSASGAAEIGSFVQRLTASRDRVLLGLSLVLLASTAFGAMPVVGRLAFDRGAGTLTFLAGRYVLAAAALGLVLALSRELRPRSRELPLRGVLLAGLATTVANIGYLGAVALDDVTRVAPIVFLFPVLVPLAAAALGRERLRPVALASVTVGVIGTVLVVGSGLALPDDPAAAGLALLAAAANVTFFMLVASALRGAGLVPLAAGMFALSAAIIAPLALLTGSGMPSAGGWAFVAIAGLACTAAPYALWLAGLGHVGESRAAALAVWEPAVAVLLAMAVLGERVSVLQAMGIGLVLGSLLAVGLRARREASGASRSASRR